MLKEKVKKAGEEIATALSCAKNPFFCVSGGKNSLVLLHIAKERVGPALKVLHINTGVEFVHVAPYLARQRKTWGFSLTTAGPAQGRGEPGVVREECCSDRKRRPLKEAVREHGIDYLLTGVCQGTDPCTAAVFREIPRCRVIAPLMPLSDHDVWEYIISHALTPCSLYDEGYSHIECVPCAVLSQDDRPLDSGGEETLMRARMKSLGYF
jgi:3'-phosphoadenosine 5'-phosphosulfate sulfotransferase (PAPS reductase)/FAD synthetase